METVEENSPPETLEENSPVDMAEENSPMDMAEENSPTDMVEENSTDMVEENYPTDMLEENSPSDMLEENSPTDLLEENSPSDIVEVNSLTDMSVLIQFAKFSKGYRISDFVDFINEVIGWENFDFFGRLAYPNQWQIRLTDKELRERLIRNGKDRIKNRKCWMYPLNQQEIRGFVHWLPNSVTNDQLKDQLQLYGEVLMVESQERKVSGRNVESDIRYYGLILTPGTLKEDLPHFLKINNYVCLVVVRGRQPACFHCREVGHRRAQCQRYKEKLTSFTQRQPNTAPPLRISRGRRHIKTVTEVEEKSGRNEVSTIDDIVCLKRQTPGDEATIDDIVCLKRQTPGDEATTDSHLSVSEDPKGLTEEHEVIGNAGLVDSGGLAVKKPKYYLDTSAAPISARGSQLQDLIETVQQFHQKATEGLQQWFNNYGKNMCKVAIEKQLSSDTRYKKEKTVCLNLEEMYHKKVEKQSTIHAPEETATPVEMGEDSPVDVEETEDLEMQSVLQTMHEVKHVAETTEKIDKKPEEMGKEMQLTEPTPADSASQMKVNSRADHMLNETAKDVFEMLTGSFKRMKELVESRRATEEFPKDSAAGTDPGPEKENCFAKQMLEKTEKSIVETFQNTFKNIEEIIKATDLCATTITNVTTISGELKQDIEIDPIFSKKEIEVDVGAGFDKTSEETVEIQPESENIDDSKAIDVFDPKKEKLITTEKAFSDSKGMEWDVSKDVQEDRDELQTAVKKIFALIQDESELLPETSEILRKVELEVIELFDGTKNRLKPESK